jgi:hypothetical protein
LVVGGFGPLAILGVNEVVVVEEGNSSKPQTVPSIPIPVLEADFDPPPKSNHYTPPQPSHYSHPTLLTFLNDPIPPTPRSLPSIPHSRF